MLQQSGSGGIDWMSLAAKMFMSKLNEKSAPQKQRSGKQLSPPPSPLRARSPVLRHRTTIPPSTLPPHLPPECVATIRQFEALRVQLLRQLVLYQSQLLAMKMPPLPSQTTQKPSQPKGKVVRSESRVVKKQTSSKKVNSGKINEAKKWEKIQFPAYTMKNPNKRRSQVFQKPKKSSKKASKRKLENLENVQTTVSTNYFENLKNKTKRVCHPYKSYMGNSSSSTSSVYSTKHLTCNHKDFGLESLTGKEATPQNNSYLNAASMNEGKINTSISRMPKSKTSKINRKMSSAFVFDTATDEAQSSL